MICILPYDQRHLQMMRVREQQQQQQRSLGVYVYASCEKKFPRSTFSFAIPSQALYLKVCVIRFPFPCLLHFHSVFVVVA